jgi:hypothetical protein
VHSATRHRESISIDDSARLLTVLSVAILLICRVIDNIVANEPDYFRNAICNRAGDLESKLITNSREGYPVIARIFGLEDKLDCSIRRVGANHFDQLLLWKFWSVAPTLNTRPATIAGGN